MFRDEEYFLFSDWIYPNTIDDFKGKEVLECGCGGGQHTSFIAPYAREVIAVDLNTVDIARERNERSGNVIFLEDDIARMNLKRQLDIVISIGVVHHTDSPDETIENLKRHLRPGGRLIVWVYSKEGNFMAERLLEPFRKIFFKNLKKKRLAALARFVTAMLYIPVYSIYMLPLKFLPYYEYFENFRMMSFERNSLNVFDKLNAPQVEFIDRARVGRWFSMDFTDVSITRYRGVSWRASGTKRCQRYY